ncbi:hypothetical protein LIER_34900 [Lithospermum erythrorhizon]|uniref:Uncharacterized protein n=1 Tax=Lithospermum erythrorhizon TaxID=34254 RepID=A0AAV3S237_LITER
MQQCHAKTIKLRPSILYSVRGPDCSITLLADCTIWLCFKSWRLFLILQIARVGRTPLPDFSGFTQLEKCSVQDNRLQGRTLNFATPVRVDIISDSNTLVSV